MVTPDRSRAAVVRLQDRFGVSQRRAHRLQRPPQRRHKLLNIIDEFTREARSDGLALPTVAVMPECIPAKVE